MGSETLTTWTCDRCLTEIVTESADTPPQRWSNCEHEDVMRHWREDVLCDDCSAALILFFANERVEPQPR